jgi:HrcA family winged helix-turn-helix transcription repressor
VAVDWLNERAGERQQTQGHIARTVEAPRGASTCINELMTKQHISAELKKFIKDQIQTAPKLEVLLLLHRQQAKSFDVQEVADELGFDSDTAREQLNALQTLELVKANAEESTFRYRPVNSELSSMVDQLAIAYRKQRVPILSAILAEDPTKHRRFVEAFKLVRTND